MNSISFEKYNNNKRMSGLQLTKQNSGNVVEGHLGSPSID